jgi:pyridoxine 5-phosphate synthase
MNSLPLPKNKLMTKLSVNINKIATLRNARGGNLPNVLKTALDIERFGAEGITVHPRPDERHIRYRDVLDLKPVLTTEFNIEGYPSAAFIDLVLGVKPAQVTLVPDPPDALTSNNGWDTVKNQDFLKTIITRFHGEGIRTSIFVNPDEDMIFHAQTTGTDRVELYTESYAKNYPDDRQRAIAPYVKAALAANKAGLGINAGHDLNLTNLKYFSENIPGLLEVSIGHALICDALYYGLENTVQLYLRLVR